jgi:hypothetical protein
MEARDRMTAAGYILIGLAAGMLIGTLAAYGFMFIWAIRYGREEDAE